MKRLVLSALAFSMMSMTAAHADYRPVPNADHRATRSFEGRPHDMRRVDRTVVVKRNGDRVVVKKVSRTHWERGYRVPNWGSRYVVRDYHRQGLYRPGHGQRWIRVDKDYLLIGITTGIIAGMIAAH